MNTLAFSFLCAALVLMLIAIGLSHATARKWREVARGYALSAQASADAAHGYARNAAETLKRLEWFSYPIRFRLGREEPESEQRTNPRDAAEPMIKNADEHLGEGVAESLRRMADKGIRTPGRGLTAGELTASEYQAIINADTSHVRDVVRRHFAEREEGEK